MSQFTSSGQLAPDELARQRAYFQEHAPGFLAAYAPGPGSAGDTVFDGHGELINPCHALACRDCGGTDFAIRFHPRAVATACAGCGAERTLLGEAEGAGHAIDCGCGRAARGVTVRLEYPGDLFEMAGEPAEGFTWITVRADCPGCGAGAILVDMETG